MTTTLVLLALGALGLAATLFLTWSLIRRPEIARNKPSQFGLLLSLVISVIALRPTVEYATDDEEFSLIVAAALWALAFWSLVKAIRPPSKAAEMPRPAGYERKRVSSREQELRGSGKVLTIGLIIVGVVVAVLSGVSRWGDPPTLWVTVTVLGAILTAAVIAANHWLGPRLFIWLQDRLSKKASAPPSE